MHFSLVKLNPNPQQQAASFDDAILPIYFALKKLGFQVETRVNTLHPTAKNILFGANQYSRLPFENIPRGTVLFNLEQTSSGGNWFTPQYVEILRQFTVWDYSARNCAELSKRFGISARHVPMGYMPEMTRIASNPKPLYDALFYGALNGRRTAALHGLQQSGVRVFLPEGVLAGAERDQMIFQSALVVNIHYYLPASLEVVRLGYLWANKKPVVSERREDTEIPPGLETACAYCLLEELTPTVHGLLQNESARKKQGEEGFRAFSALDQAEILKKLVGMRKTPVAPPPFPEHLNIGSGGEFMEDAVNIDILPRCNPDIVLDISEPLDEERVHETERFGKMRLKKGSFRKITMFEVLEHVADLPQTMRNALDLLCDGGEFEISVPYEFSLGAAQDPTHVRFFNEKSWLYYTEWAGYMGWRDERFDVAYLDYVVSDIGADILKKGGPGARAEMLRTPRAVHGIKVILRKRGSTEKEKLEYDRRHRNFYITPVKDWIV